jgi:RNA polymerase sigma factor (sigma-70 family)
MDHSEERVSELTHQERGPSHHPADGRLPDSELVARAGRGDQAAWEALMRRYQEPAFRLAYLLLGDAAEAEDITQDAFVRAFLHLETYDGERPLRPWLLRIVANLARNRRRALGRYLAALRRLFALAPRSVDVPCGRDSQAQWEAQRLREAVGRLSRAGQEVVYCRYFLDLSEAETAEVLGIARGTVKSRTHRVLRQLRAVIEKEFPGLRAARLE